jgi:cytochrome P450
MPVTGDVSARAVLDDRPLPELVMEFLQQPSSRANPYPMFERLRDEDPVHLTTDGTAVLSRYADLDGIFRSPQMLSRHAAADDELAHLRCDDPVVTRAINGKLDMFMNLDPPAHKRQRGLVAKTFTPRAIEQWRATARDIVSEIIDDIKHLDEFDFVAKVAYPLPEKVICRILGVPHEDHQMWRAWSTDSTQFNRVGKSGESVIDGARNAIKSFYEYFDRLITERRKHPGADLISELIAIEEDGDRLSADEMIATLTILITAGHETTAALTASGMYGLMSHPDQYTAFYADTAIVPGAIEEFLRFYPPAWIANSRVALGDLPLPSGTVPAGSRIVPLVGSANRDPRYFGNADALDIHRPVAENRHFGFGMGIHHCIGASLARLEAREIFTRLATADRKLRLIAEPTWQTQHLRCLDSLYVSWAS